MSGVICCCITKLNPNAACCVSVCVCVDCVSCLVKMVLKSDRFCLSDTRDSVKEQQPFLGRGRQQSPGSLDADVLDEGPDADEESKGHDEPPKPRVFVRGEIGRVLHDQGPLGQREAESAERTVTGRDGVTEAGQHQESDPVEQERYQESRHEDNVRAQQTVVGVDVFSVGVDGDECDGRSGSVRSNSAPSAEGKARDAGWWRWQHVSRGTRRNRQLVVDHFFHLNLFVRRQLYRGGHLLGLSVLMTEVVRRLVRRRGAKVRLGRGQIIVVVAVVVCRWHRELLLASRSTWSRRTWQK